MPRKLEFAVNKSEKEVRFASWLTISLFTLAVALMLFLLFPERRLSVILTNPESPSTITADYLKVMLASEPHNNAIRLLYAQQLVRLNEIPRAKEQIALLQEGGPLYQQQAVLLNYEIRRIELYALPEKSPQHEAQKKNLQSLLVKIDQENPNFNQLIMLLEDAAYLNEKRLGEIFIKKLEPFQKNMQVAQAVKVAVNALTIGDYKSSAHYYFLAQQKSASLHEKRKYFIAALRSLEMGDQVKLAVALGKKNLGILKDDRQALNYLTRLSLQVNEYDEANKAVIQSIGLELKKP
jgi:hypothetical protein